MKIQEIGCYMRSLCGEVTYLPEMSTLPTSSGHPGNLLLKA